MPDATPATPASTPAATPSAAPAPSPAPPSTPAPAPAAPSATPAPEGAKTTPAPSKRFRFKSGDVEEIFEGAEAEWLEKLSTKMRLSPDELLKGPQMHHSSYQRWQEAKKLREEAEKIQAEAKKRYEDPRITEIKAKEPGISDEDAWALLRVQEMYERAQMNPDQRALAEERAKREALERQAKEREEQAKQAKLQAETKAAAVRVDREVTEAMTKHGMPRDPKWARAVLDHLATMIRAGEEPDMEGAVLHVRRLVQADDRVRLAALPDEQLEGWLGKEIVDRLLKRSVAKVNGGAQPTAPTPLAPAPKEEPAFITDVDEWRRRYRD